MDLGEDYCIVGDAEQESIKSKAKLGSDAAAETVFTWPSTPELPGSLIELKTEVETKDVATQVLDSPCSPFSNSQEGDDEFALDFQSTDEFFDAAPFIQEASGVEEEHHSSASHGDWSPDRKSMTVSNRISSAPVLENKRPDSSATDNPHPSLDTGPEEFEDNQPPPDSLENEGQPSEDSSDFGADDEGDNDGLLMRAGKSNERHPVTASEFSGTQEFVKVPLVPVDAHQEDR